MNCKCGIKSFFFEKTTAEGTFNVFVCDAPESKKKGKCDFFYSQKIKETFKKETTDALQPHCSHPEVNQMETYMKDLNKYIRLLKNATHLPKDYSTNYIANINYILKKLNMKFYFEDTESIECLEKRIINNEYTLCSNDTSGITFPLKLTEYPPQLCVPLKTKRKKKRKKTSKVEVQKLDLKTFIEEDEKAKQEEEIDNKSESSEDSSEMSEENDDDNTFDVDDYNSDAEDSFDDAGAFSD